MSDVDNIDEPGTFSSPGFLMAAVFLGLLLAAGIVVAFISSGDDPSVEPPVAAPLTASPTGNTSVCGLGGYEAAGTLTKPPKGVVWRNDGILGYPATSAGGPAAKAPGGYQYCFAHTPEGAALAAAYFAMHSSTAAAKSDGWLSYAVSPGAHQSEISQPSTADEVGLRMEHQGFRLLAYSGDRARVDLSMWGSTSDGEATISAVYELVWSAGDWKLNGASAAPVNIGRSSSDTEYVPWKAPK